VLDFQLQSPISVVPATKAQPLSPSPAG
jgi:hypothetical protein